MPAPEKWSWNIGNVNASAAQTQAAYQAITNNGSTRNFNVIVWNDIIDKIIEQREYWGDIEWSQIALTRSATKMIPGNRMTADRFNTAVLNMPPIHPWGWEETLGRKDIHPGDVCYGVYFIYLVDGLNHWMDLAPLPDGAPLRINVDIDTLAHVRRALHVTSNPHFILTPVAHPILDRVKPIISNYHSYLTVQFHLPLLTVNHVMILLMGNTRIRDKTVVATAQHVAGDLNPSVVVSGSITTGTLAFVFGDLTAESTFTAKLGLPGINHIIAGADYGLTGPAGAVYALQPKIAHGLIPGTFSGEAYVMEPDSLKFSADMPATYVGNLTFSNMEAQYIAVAVNGVFLGRAKPILLNADNIAVNLNDVTLSTHAYCLLTGRSFLSAQYVADSFLFATMHRRRRTVLGGVDVSGTQSGTGTLVFLAVELPTGAALNIQSDLSACAVFSDDTIIRTGATATGSLTTTATVAGATNTDATSAALTGSMAGPQGEADVISTGRLLTISAGVTGTSTMSATIDSQGYVLASEIDDVLASELDNTLVSDVEYHQ